MHRSTMSSDHEQDPSSWWTQGIFRNTLSSRVPQMHIHPVIMSSCISTSLSYPSRHSSSSHDNSHEHIQAPRQDQLRAGNMPKKYSSDRSGRSRQRHTRMNGTMHCSNCLPRNRKIFTDIMKFSVRTIRRIHDNNKLTQWIAQATEHSP